MTLNKKQKDDLMIYGGFGCAFAIMWGGFWVGSFIQAYAWYFPPLLITMIPAFLLSVAAGVKGLFSRG